MDAEGARSFLLTLPHVVETMQWGDNLVFWVGDKAIGGKMFALISLGARDRFIVSFAAGAEAAAEHCEQDGMSPAPYLARAGWVAAERWDVLRAREWQDVFRAAHAVITAKLPRPTQAALALSETAQRKLIQERRQLLATRAAAASKRTPARNAS